MDDPRVVDLLHRCLLVVGNLHLKEPWHVQNGRKGKHAAKDGRGGIPAAIVDPGGGRGGRGGEGGRAVAATAAPPPIADSAAAAAVAQPRHLLPLVAAAFEPSAEMLEPL